jgi:hypothetical protein
MSKLAMLFFTASTAELKSSMAEMTYWFFQLATFSL